jgi:hypothetical protein
MGYVINDEIAKENYVGLKDYLFLIIESDLRKLQNSNVSEFELEVTISKQAS